MVDVLDELGVSVAMVVSLGQLLLLGLIAALAVLLIREVRRLNHSVFIFDNSVHERLRGLQVGIDRAGPARYALASFIAAQRGSARSTADLRHEFEAMVSDLDRLEEAVEDVLRALEGSGGSGENARVPAAGRDTPPASGQQAFAQGKGGYGDAA